MNFHLVVLRTSVISIVSTYGELVNSVKLCLHERLLAYLSPDTVTGDDGRHQNRCRGGCRLKWNMSQCLVRSDTVMYEAANQRPVDELLLTFSLLSPTGAILTLSDTVCQFNGRHANGNDLLSRSIEVACPCLSRLCKHLVNLCRASTAVTWRPTTRSQIGRVNRPLDHQLQGYLKYESGYYLSIRQNVIVFRHPENEPLCYVT